MNVPPGMPPKHELTSGQYLQDGGPWESFLGAVGAFQDVLLCRVIVAVGEWLLRRLHQPVLMGQPPELAEPALPSPDLGNKGASSVL